MLLYNPIDRTTRGQRLHTTCCALAYQLLCKRTSAVVRLKELHFTKTEPTFSGNFSYLFRRLPKHSSASFPTNNTYIPYRKQTKSPFTLKSLPIKQDSRSVKGLFVCQIEKKLPYSTHTTTTPFLVNPPFGVKR